MAARTSKGKVVKIVDADGYEVRTYLTPNYNYRTRRDGSVHVYPITSKCIYRCRLRYPDEEEVAAIHAAIRAGRTRKSVGEEFGLSPFRLRNLLLLPLPEASEKTADVPAEAEDEAEASPPAVSP